MGFKFESEIDITKNKFRMRKVYRDIPNDCFNPYRDYRNDIFSYDCLFPDMIKSDTKSDYKFRLKNRIKKSNYCQ